MTFLDPAMSLVSASRVGGADGDVQEPRSRWARRLWAARAISLRSRQICRSCSRSAAPLRPVEPRPRPPAPPLLARMQPLIDALIALDIVANAAGCVEIDGL